MNKRLNQIIAMVLVLGFATLIGCKKEDTLTVPPEQATFLGRTNGSYSVVTANSSYFIKVGTTTVSNVDRTFNFTVSSSTGASSPAQYSLPKNSFTIPAGKAVDSIEVKGVLAAYQAGRKDTLTFTITEAGKETGFNSVFKLAMRGPCFEGEVDLNILRGDYKNTNEDFGGPYGPYITTVTAVEQTSATTGTITVANLFDFGWNPVKFKLDWTDAANRTVTLDQQANIGPGGTIGAAYNGRDISVRPFAGQVGTFSVCNQTIMLKLQLGITGLGFFGTLYTVDMRR